MALYSQLNADSVCIGISNLAREVDDPKLVPITGDDKLIGWRLVEGEWQPPMPLAPVLPPLTRRRLRLGLLSIGIRSADIEAVIAAIPDAEAREWAMIEWQDASEYERDHPLIADAMAALDLPAEQVDTLWLWAAGL